jgi:hypothetical protein
MKRFRRRKFAMLAGISLVLFVGTLGLWIESEFASCGGFWVDSTTQIQIECGGGEVSFTVCELQSPLGPASPEIHFFRLSYRFGAVSWGRQCVHYAGRALRLWDQLGFHFLYHANQVTWSVPGTISLVSIPLWLPAATFSVSPIIWLAQTRLRRYRGRNNLCPTCGYDLRATPERCPECGTIPPNKEIISA